MYFICLLMWGGFSMYISELIVKNYRSLKDVHLKFNRGRNVLVGKNNSGKSNIIKAIDLVLGEKFPTYIKVEEKDFFSEKIVINGNNITASSDYFLILVKLGGNESEVNNSLLEKCKGINVSKDSKRDLFIISEDGELIFNPFFTQDVDSFSRYEKEWKNGYKLHDFFSTMKEICLYLYVEKDKETLDHDSKYKKTYGMIVRKDDVYFRCWPINNNIRDALITSAILPAFRDPQTQFKINDWSWYGKLIKSIWEEKSHTIRTDIEDNVKNIRDLSNQVFEQAISDLKEKLSEVIYHHSVSFQLLPNTKDDIYKGVNLLVDDGIESLASDKGAGIQSALIIGLFSYYCRKFHKNSSLLAIEEPELYLHPHARRVLSSKFDEFVNQNKTIQNQVIIATHSPEFIRNTEINNITVVRKPITSSNTIVKQVIINEENSKEIQKIKQVLWSKNAEMFFADKVILVEGGEEYLLPAIANKLLEKDNALDFHNISVIRVGGKRQFNIYIKILRDLGIDFFVLADFDFIMSGLEDLKDYIQEYSAEELSRVREIINSFMISQEEDPYRNSKEIKRKFETGVAKQLCILLDDMCEKREYKEELKKLWEEFRPSITKKKINYSSIEHDSEAKNFIDNFLEKLKENNVYILKYGELEDYRTELAIKILHEQRVSGKELSVLKLIELVNQNDYEIDDLFIIGEYGELIKKAVGL